jgi:alkylated DNA repair dioxygenase AlkB
MNKTNIITTDNSKLWKVNYFSTEESKKLFDLCKNLPLIKNPKIKIFGKDAEMHRSVGFFSDESKGYKYSNQISKSIELPPFLKELLEKINKEFDTDFNGILVNMYSSGEDYIGAHSDDEKGLGKRSTVIGISLGETRIMRFRGKKTPIIQNGKKYVDMEMPNGCLFSMEDFQKEFTHEIPIQKKINGTRISLTFRKHLE